MSDTPDEKTTVRVEGLGGSSTLSKVETSTQLQDQRIRSLNIGVQPPYNPDRLAAYLELNETHSTAVRKKARWEVGYGFELVPHRGINPDDADEDQRALTRDFWRGRESRWQTGPHQSAEPTSPEEVKELARQDYHQIGWGALEILTDLEGRPVGLAHVPANSLRVRKPQSRFDEARHPEEGRFVDTDVARFASRGYVQIRDGQRRYFGEAGDRYRGLSPSISGGDGDDPPRVTYENDGNDDREPIFVDRETGDVVRGSADSLPNGPANELIFIRNPSPLEQDYGVPDWVSAIRTISSDEAAKDYNRSFFRHDTIPRFVIKVTGGELSAESRRDLEQMLDNLRGESHRAVVLEVEKFINDGALGEDSDVEIELVPLGQGISEEMDFRQYRAKNEHEIAKVHEVPPILIGVTETSNRSNSAEQVQDFANNIIAPEQHKFASRLYQVLHQQALGVTDWTIEYELRGAKQPKEDAKMAEQRVRAMRLAGVGTVNEARGELGLDPLGEPLGDMTLAEFEAQFTAGAGEDEEGGSEAALNAQTPPAENKIGEREWDATRAALTEKETETMQFSSSNLDEGLYDFDEQELYLSFIRADGPNSLYAYVDISPAEWAALTSASSHGGYHYDNIRLEYPYIEITNFHDRLPEGPTPDPDDVPDDIPM